MLRDRRQMGRAIFRIGAWNGRSRGSCQDDSGTGIADSPRDLRLASAGCWRCCFVPREKPSSLSAAAQAASETEPSTPPSAWRCRLEWPKGPVITVFQNDGQYTPLGAETTVSPPALQSVERTLTDDCSDGLGWAGATFQMAVTVSVSIRSHPATVFLLVPTQSANGAPKVATAG